MRAPARGAAATLAGRAASGIAPNVGTSTGATASCAPAVMPSASRTQRGPGRRATIGGASRSTPRHAVTLRRNPTDRVRSGSTTSSAATASARWRRPPDGRPDVVAQSATAATAAARTTEGSKRVRNAKPVTSATATTKRGQIPRRRRTGPATARMKTRFCPETASKCVSPDARKSAASSAGWSRSSPSVRPASSARCRSGSDEAPWSRMRRRPFAAAACGAPSATAATDSTRRRPAT